MDRRLIPYFVVSFAVVVGYMTFMQNLRKPQVAKQGQEQQAAQEADAKNKEKENGSKAKSEEKKAPSSETTAKDGKKDEKQAAEETKPKKEIVEEPEPAQEWLTLGSVDPEDPYRMMVTLTNRGAALARIELSNSQYRDIDIRSGYLGHLVMDASSKNCRVQLVGPGTPAAKADMKVGDLIKQIDQHPIDSPATLKEVLGKSKPGQSIDILVDRAGEEKKLQAKLTRYPLEVIRPASDDPLTPEADDPLSLLMTLQQVDDEKLSGIEKDKEIKLNSELKGVSLRNGVWTKVEADRDHAIFLKKLPKLGLEVYKSYRLEKVPDESKNDLNFKAYHLLVNIKIVNQSDETRNIAYQLDGPNGLPTEGSWYANKSSRNWSGAGLRDVLVSFNQGTPKMISCLSIADNKLEPPWEQQPITYVGVDAQYFSAVLIPQTANPQDIWFGPSQAMTVGKVDPVHKNQANTSFRLVGLPQKIQAGKDLSQEYLLFAGPKKPDLIAQYQLSSLVYYGWFGWVAEPMLWILHGFYYVVGNYGIAIIMLTILVRGCMFPLSFKQALGAQKMAEIQPEMKRIAEKFKKDVEGRTRAMQELYRKYNYNPFSGCLVIFIQLPIFVGLYKSLMVDVELRDAPLIASSVRWCSNLAAPDMLMSWKDYMFPFIQSWLGPYFNILPIFTIILFLWQQHKMMPPPTDEQQAMQQKMMKYMMIFMGIMFFKVASGLCIYFIASSLWGLGERQFLPKKPAPTTGNVVPRSSSPSTNGESGKSARKKHRDRT